MKRNKKAPDASRTEGSEIFTKIPTYLYENTAYVRTRLPVNHPLNVPGTALCRGRLCE